MGREPLIEFKNVHVQNTTQAPQNSPIVNVSRDEYYESKKCECGTRLGRRVLGNNGFGLKFMEFCPQCQDAYLYDTFNTKRDNDTFTVYGKVEIPLPQCFVEGCPDSIAHFVESFNNSKDGDPKKDIHFDDFICKEHSIIQKKKSLLNFFLNVILIFPSIIIGGAFFGLAGCANANDWKGMGISLGALIVGVLFFSFIHGFKDNLWKKKPLIKKEEYRLNSKDTIIGRRNK